MNLCLEIAATVEPCEGKALASSDDQSACIKRRGLRDQFLTQLH